MSASHNVVVVWSLFSCVQLLRDQRNIARAALSVGSWRVCVCVCVFLIKDDIRARADCEEMASAVKRARVDYAAMASQPAAPAEARPAEEANLSQNGYGM